MKPLVVKMFPRIVALLMPMTPAALHSEPADELIAKGDSYYARLMAADALKCYLPAEKLEPNNVHLLVRISREYRHLMSDATTTHGTTLETRNQPAAAAISYGKLEPLETNRDKFEASRIIKKAADKAIKLDPSSDLAWHVLGRWHLALAELSSFQRAMAQFLYGKLPDSTYQEAAQCFEKAIELNPNRLMHYIELGRVYVYLGRTDDARSLISKGLAMRETEKDDPETKHQGKELLASIR